jgi:hypothetical protein
MAAPLLVIGALLLLGALTVTFWNHIFDAFTETILPFLRENLPALAPFVEDAFIKLDKVVASVRAAAREAWRKVRDYIFSAEEVYERTAPGEYTATQHVWAVTDDDAAHVHEVTSTRRVTLDDMPDEIRAKFVMAQRARADVLTTRDQEMEMAL